MVLGGQKTGSGILDAIGNTPLVKVSDTLGLSPKKHILVKLEYLNPGGSVKDRPAFFIVQEAVRSGSLSGGKKILDATSGNMGIGLSLVGAALDIGVKLVMPSNASREKQAIMRILGAEIVLTDPLEGIDGAIKTARRMVEEEPNAYYYADQYSNPANVKAHYETTGKEIIEQTAGKVTHFVAGVGTSGTLTGAGRRLREYNPSVRIVEVQPEEPLHGIEGLKHMQSSLVPAIYDPGFADDHLSISTEEAYDYAKLLVSKAGLLAGLSGGANVAAALRVAETIHEGVIVTMIPDGVIRYMDILYGT